MPGAVLLAGEACLRVGAGLVTIVTVPEHATAFVARRPNSSALPPRIHSRSSANWQRHAVIAIGPGLGRSPWAIAMLDAALAANAPLVVDADALNLLAERALACRHAPW
jgi:NAD(P)H-hydrate epimerase